MSAKQKKTTKPTSNGSRRSAQAKPKTPSGARSASGANSKSQSNAHRAPRVLTDTVKNDIIGLIIAILGVVILVLVITPSDAVGAVVISDGIRLLIGVGAYILPFIIIIWGMAFFVKRRSTYAPLRLVLGLALIFLGIISLLAASTPYADIMPSEIFVKNNLMAQGGYLGGAFAWAGLSLIGSLATTIIFVGFILVGIVLIGFSISSFIDRTSTAVQGRFGRARHQEETQGAYRLSAQQGAEQGHSSVLAPTRLKNAPDDALYTDAFNEGAQGKLPLDATADLGSTRRLKTGQSFAPGTIGAAALHNEDTSILAKDADSVDGAGATTANAGKKRSKTSPSSSPAHVGDFKLPDMRILRISRDKAATKAGANELKATATRLQATLEEFGVDGKVIGWVAGPTVTLYKVSLGEGVRLNRVTNLQDDIQLALAALAIRIVAPIPGTSLVGIEVPNDTRNVVLMGDVLPAAQPGPLQLAIGKDVEGDAITADLAKMPHLLIGGTTGSGKSVAINSIIMSILMRATPSEVRMILIDPKRVELSLYNGIPHLFVPVVTDPHQAASALSWAVVEMERRLKLFQKHGAKNISQFNVKVTTEMERRTAEEAVATAKAARTSEKAVTLHDEAANTITLEKKADAQADTNEFPAVQETNRETPVVLHDDLSEKLPYIVIVIDELADLMMVAGKDVEASISRLAQLARAAGLHLIVATQRPSTNVITGLIKANIVNRIAFTVASGIDSRVILDTQGAEDLIGSGDLLFGRPEYSKPVRIQGCYVSEPEIETVVEFLQSQGEPDYHEDILFTKSLSSAGSAASGGADMGDDDPLLWEAADIVVSSGLGSTSTLQRRLKVGYARAGRIMDMLEMKGIVGPPNGSKPREVLLDDVLDLETLKAFDSQ